MNDKPASQTAVGQARRNNALISVFLGLIALILFCAALREIKIVVIPLVFAWMIAQLLTPMVSFFGKHRVRAGLAICFSLVLLLTAFGIVAIFVSASAKTSFIAKFDEYNEQTKVIVRDVQEWIQTRFKTDTNEAIEMEVQKQIASLFGTVMKTTKDSVLALANVLANLLLIFIIVAFMLFAKPYAATKIRKAFAPRTAERVTDIMSTISGQISQYLAMQFLISLATGLLVWASCKFIGVGAAATWGALAFFLNFIPVIGSILAGVPPVLLALLQYYPRVGPAIAMLVCVIVVNQVLGNIVAPKVMGDKLNLSPVTVLLSMLFWWLLWGIPGAFLSVVIAASIKIVCDNIGPLRPIGVLMASGRSLEKMHKSLQNR